MTDEEPRLTEESMTDDATDDPDTNDGQAPDSESSSDPDDDRVTLGGDAEPNDDETATGDAEPNGGAPATEDAAGVSRFADRQYFNYVVLAVLSVLAFVSLVQFYLSVGSAINRWIEPEYRSLFQAAFNLAVLLLTGAGISIQLRRMRRD